MLKKRGLGKGLGELLPEADQKTAEEIDISLITPNRWQPRREFDEESLRILAVSIKENGLVQPIIVRKKNGEHYELVAGERRLRAAQIAGLEYIPAVIRQYNDEETAKITLIENVQREDLNPLEEGMAYQKLIDEYNFTQEEMADIVGKSRSYVTNILRLLDLPETIRIYLAEKKITAGQARPLLGLDIPAIQLKLARRIVEEGLSARKVEELIRLNKFPKNTKKEKEEGSSYFHKLEEELRLFVGTKVVVKMGKGRNAHKGTVTLSFKNDKEFTRIMSILGQEATGENDD